MGRNPSLLATTRAQIVALAKEGYSERQIAQRFNCSKTAIHQAITRYTIDKSFNDAQDALG